VRPPGRPKGEHRRAQPEGTPMSAPQTANLSTLLAQTAALFPDRPGLIHGERVWTWREIDARVDALVQGLRSA
jgi:fatty-acyl-CoA synthase